METYDVPRSNPYIDSRHRGAILMKPVQDGEEDNNPTQYYASVASAVNCAEDIPVRENDAYESSCKYKTTCTETPLYAVPHRNRQEMTRKRHEKREHCKNCCLVLCIFTVLLVAVLALAEATMALLIILRDLESCSCVTSTGPTSSSTENTSGPMTSVVLQKEVLRLASKLSVLENRITDSITERQEQYETINYRITNSSSFLNSFIQARSRNYSGDAQPLYPRQALYNCSTRVEASCTVEADIGQCITDSVPVTCANSTFLHSDCVRVDSREQSPLVGVMDITAGQMMCLCYVVEIGGVTRTHPTQCSLLVTRCLTVN